MPASIESFARKIAREAGAILLRGFRSSDTVVSYKGRTNLVTNIDQESEEFLFSSISRWFPDHSIIAEEGSEKDAGGEFIWYVDPLDGTNNYAHGIAQFCVSLGVYSRKDRSGLVGVVYDPYHDEMFIAVTGQGAFCNGTRIAVSTADQLCSSILSTGFPYDKDVNEDNNLREFARIVPRIQGIRRMGSAALDLASVACGRLEGYWERGINAWDIAAGALLVQEAGGTVSGYRGEPLEIDGGRIVATNGPLHQSLLNLLVPA